MSEYLKTRDGAETKNGASHPLLDAFNLVICICVVVVAYLLGGALPAIVTAVLLFPARFFIGCLGLPLIYSVWVYWAWRLSGDERQWIWLAVIVGLCILAEVIAIGDKVASIRRKRSQAELIDDLATLKAKEAKLADQYQRMMGAKEHALEEFAKIGERRKRESVNGNDDPATNLMLEKAEARIYEEWVQNEKRIMEEDEA